jgi:hypothetical protein
VPRCLAVSGGLQRFSDLRGSPRLGRLSRRTAGFGQQKELAAQWISVRGRGRVPGGCLPAVSRPSRPGHDAQRPPPPASVHPRSWPARRAATGAITLAAPRVRPPADAGSWVGLCSGAAWSVLTDVSLAADLVRDGLDRS